ncbi:hypothetical protein [Vibrio sp. 1641]|uniref:hypothetical protein n=1 Tax=Vibrio sp. 1641 TaxID=3074571 RepID=UPI0021CF3199|nr:hypothetical protein [Vibrio sp. 1641]MDW2193320.1 hypothetical protein [Vibrio sp. 1641]
MKILFIAYYLPPFAGVGQFRAAKFLKFLSKDENIENLDVITVDDKYYDRVCSDKLDVGSNVNVIKTKVSSVLKNFINEEGVFWSPYLFPKLIKMLFNNKYDAIYVNGNPFFHIPFVVILGRLFNVKVIVDYRDPWLLSPYRKFDGLKGGVISCLEKITVNLSSFLINVTQSATQMHKEKYSDYIEKFKTIENGFDDDDFNFLTPFKKRDDKLRVVYSGKFSDFRNPEEFIRALSNVKESFDFLHVGLQEDSVIELVKKYDIQDIYTCTGYVSYANAVEAMRSADIGLIISGGHPYEPTTKIFDYIALGLKKLVVTDNINKGFLYESLNDDSSSRICKNSRDEILESLVFLAKNDLSQNDNLKVRFSRKEQSKQLMSVFNE